MLIIWKGKGLVVPVAALLAVLVPGLIAYAISPSYTRAHSWFYAIGWLGVGVGLFFYGIVLNKGIPRLVFGPELVGNHHFIGWRVEYWGIFFAGIGGVNLAMDISAGAY